MDLTGWVGLLTLVLLEIILGIDNLVFVAILADKLPADKRDRARRIGLSLALLMRLGLLAGISWLTTLTVPLFTLFSINLSARDLILTGGGLFLLIKATVEIHDRLEGGAQEPASAVVHGAFWPIVAQIVVLDVVFSIDSVITAVGMVDLLYMMMAAVIIAVGAMIALSKPLSAFLLAHDSLVILCLGFLLMVGLTLIVDGLGYHIPKSYLYAAIGFSMLIEALNQLALRNRRKQAASMPPRQRMADAVLRLLGAVPIGLATGETMNERPPEHPTIDAFAPAEKTMVRGVLSLADRAVQTIMTPRLEVVWLDTEASTEEIMATVRSSAHRQFLVARGSIDQFEGTARREDILELRLAQQGFDLSRAVRRAEVVQESVSVLSTLQLFQQAPMEMAVVVDEYGDLKGIVTQTDLLEAIAGQIPDVDEQGQWCRKTHRRRIPP